MVDLFSPIVVGGQTLPNRIFMAPMTRNRAPDRIANQMMADYYGLRAGAGLIITEGSQIAAGAVGYLATPGIHDAAQVDGWRLVTDAVHAHDGRIYLQLWHCGRISHPDLLGGALPVAPSAINPGVKAFTAEGVKESVVPRALETEEIAPIVAAYAAAAANARRAGFDGVEIHAANGYLIDQFLRDGSNRRTDGYGGSIENRCRFLLEVTAAVVEGFGRADRVAVRLSPWQPYHGMYDSHPEALFTHVCRELGRFGLAYLHITEMGLEMPGAAGPTFSPRRLREAWKGIYVTNAGYDKARANAAIGGGAADAVAFGVPFIANPDLIERLRVDAPLATADTKTYYRGGEKGYLDYPTLK